MKTGIKQIRRERDSKSEGKTETPKDNKHEERRPSREPKKTEEQFKRKPTRKVILEMVREGFLTKEEGQDQLEEWGLNGCRNAESTRKDTISRQTEREGHTNPRTTAHALQGRGQKIQTTDHTVDDD